MCGIFGYFNLNDSEVFYDIGKYSETRGKEASGYININQGKQQVQKFPLPFSDNLVKKNILSSQLNKNGNTLIGHTRLKTHGDEGLEINNQPVISNKISEHTIKLIEDFDFHEYFDPLNGNGCGCVNFSWSASIYILLKNNYDFK